MLTRRPLPIRHAGGALAGAAVVAIVIALSATALHGSADASVARSSVVRTPRIADGRLGGAAAPISQLGAAAADATLGMRIAYYEPAALTDTAAPGTTILGGPDTPDPFIAAQDGTYYLFTSQGTQPANVPVMSGSTVGQWGPMTDALPDLPAWAEPGGTWAPDAQRFGNHYVLYFTAAIRDPNARIECIGDAVSTKLAGPYISAAAPFICQLAQGGSIDPRTFIDSNGQPYLLWKSDENSDVSGTSLTNIYSQPLSADGLHLLGQPTRIFGPDEPWQGRIVEAPDLVLVKGAYYLFYSGGWFNQPGYAIGVATCAGPAGPCADTSPSPLLSSNDQGVGPGEESVFSNARGIWLVYTPFRSTLPLPGPPRPVAMAHLGFGPTGPYLAAPESVGTGG